MIYACVWWPGIVLQYITRENNGVTIQSTQATRYITTCVSRRRRWDKHGFGKKEKSLDLFIANLSLWSRALVSRHIWSKTDHDKAGFTPGRPRDGQVALMWESALSLSQGVISSWKLIATWCSCVNAWFSVSLYSTHQGSLLVAGKHDGNSQKCRTESSRTKRKSADQWVTSWWPQTVCAGLCQIGLAGMQTSISEQLSAACVLLFDVTYTLTSLSAPWRRCTLCGCICVFFVFQFLFHVRKLRGKHIAGRCVNSSCSTLPSSKESVSHWERVQPQSSVSEGREQLFTQ